MSKLIRGVLESIPWIPDSLREKRVRLSSNPTTRYVIPSSRSTIDSYWLGFVLPPPFHDTQCASMANCELSTYGQPRA